jgi:hypothetical protein
LLVLYAVPAAQVAHADDPPAAKVLGQHAAHVAIEVAPSDVENVPASQAVHCTKPTPVAYVPALHRAHALEPTPFENVPSGQFTQLVPAEFEYCPTAQFKHAEVSICPEQDGLEQTKAWCSWLQGILFQAYVA